MKRGMVLCFLLMVVVFYTTKAQEIYFEDKMPLKGKGQTILLDNSDEPKLMVLDARGIKLRGLEKNSEWENYAAEKFHRKEIIGHIRDNGLTIFFKEKGNSEIKFLTINEKSGKVSEGILNFVKPKEERILNFISCNKKFYVLTITRNSSTLHFHTFHHLRKEGVKNIDCSKHFYGRSFFAALKEGSIKGPNLQFSGIASLSKMENEFDLSMRDVSDKSKLYVDRDSSKLYITLDREAFNTKLLSISLKDFTYNFKLIDHKMTCDPNGLLYVNNNSNSFIHESELYQTTICKDKFVLSIKSLDGGLRREWVFDENNHEKIYFEDGYGKNLKFEKAVRKISKLDAGIIVRRIQDELYLNLGGYMKSTTAYGEAIVIFFFDLIIDSKDDTLKTFTRSPKALIACKYHRRTYKFVTNYTFNGDVFIAFYDNLEKNFVIKKY